VGPGPGKILGSIHAYSHPAEANKNYVAVEWKRNLLRNGPCNC